MSYEWITPKTDWDVTSKFVYTDYNRIRNNLLYINDVLNNAYPDKAETLDLGEAKEGFTNDYYSSEFTAFEDALVSFTRIGKDLNIGTRGFYKGNDSFITADALNRLEQCCLRWKNGSENVVTQIIPETDNWQIPYWRYSYLPITLLPSDATNQSDLTATIVSSTPEEGYSWVIESVSIENGKIKNGNLRVFASGLGTAVVKLKCGEVEKNINIAIAHTADSIYLSSTRNGDTKIGGMSIWTTSSPKTYYAVTSPKDAIDKNNYTYVLSDNTIVNVERSNDALTFSPLKAGQTTLVLAINNRTWKVNIRVNQDN